MWKFRADFWGKLSCLAYNCDLCAYYLNSRNLRLCCELLELLDVYTQIVILRNFTHNCKMRNLDAKSPTKMTHDCGKVELVGLFRGRVNLGYRNTQDFGQRGIPHGPSRLVEESMELD